LDWREGLGTVDKEVNPQGDFIFEYEGVIITNVEIMQRRASSRLEESDAFR